MSVTFPTDKVKELREITQRLTSKQVLIGIPAENAPRDDGGQFNNAEIGYVQETGCPERNIPARPHLVPAIHAIADRSVRILKLAAQAMMTVEGKPETIDAALMKIGMLGALEAQKIIQSKIPPPLADSTLKRRASRKANNKQGLRITKGAQAELAMRGEMRAQFGADLMPASVNVTPLIDSGEYIHKITFVVRNRTR